MNCYDLYSCLRTIHGRCGRFSYGKKQAGVFWRGLKRHIGGGELVELQISKTGVGALAGDDAANAFGAHIAAQVFPGFFGGGFGAAAQDEAALAVVRSFFEAEGQIVSPNVGLLPGAPAMTAVYEGRPVFCLPSSPAGSLSAFSALVLPTLLLMSRRPIGQYVSAQSGAPTECCELTAELAASLPAYPGLDVFSPLALARVGEKTVALPLRLGEGYKTTVRTQGFAHISANGKGAPLGPG